ncbi:hypothetical protein FCOIX_9492 [Fusarium coicis]|nr:hypothetical protein FCOIX_9492 [Fusarium coicis]
MRNTLLLWPLQQRLGIHDAPEGTTSPHAYDFCPFDVTQFRQVEPSTVMATWAPLPGYSTLPRVPDSKTQKHREEKEPKNISVMKGELSHRACL